MRLASSSSLQSNLKDTRTGEEGLGGTSRREDLEGRHEGRRSVDVRNYYVW